MKLDEISDKLNTAMHRLHAFMIGLAGLSLVIAGLLNHTRPFYVRAAVAVAGILLIRVSFLVPKALACVHNSMNRFFDKEK